MYIYEEFFFFIFIKLVYLSSVISLKWQSEITQLKYTSLIKMVILEENFKWHLEAFASELFIYIYISCFQLKPLKLVF